MLTISINPVNSQLPVHLLPLDGVMLSILHIMVLPEEIVIELADNPVRLPRVIGEVSFIQVGNEPEHRPTDTVVRFCLVR